MEKEREAEIAERIRENIGKVMVGRDETITLLLASLIAGGHVLLEDVPGTGKTTLAKSLAASLDMEYRRIQFTPDLLPSDVLGIEWYSEKEKDFVFRSGPVFTNILLADEINRATPRTQSGLLECMEERQVTLDGVTRALPEPFMVIATENPLETAGTYPLPEAQMDRFFMMLDMGYPTVPEEKEILCRFLSSAPLSSLSAVASPGDILSMRSRAEKIFVHPVLIDYVARLSAETRKDGDGISVRGSLSLLKASRAMALLSSRTFVTPDDIKRVAVPVLAHRIAAFSGLGKRKGRQMVEELLDTVAVPVEKWEGR